MADSEFDIHVVTPSKESGSTKLENSQDLDIIYCLNCEHVVPVDRLSSHNCRKQLPAVGSLSLPTTSTTMSSSPSKGSRRNRSGTFRKKSVSLFSRAKKTFFGASRTEDLFPDLGYDSFVKQLGEPDGRSLRRLLLEFEERHSGSSSNISTGGDGVNGLQPSLLSFEECGRECQKFVDKVVGRLKGQRTQQETVLIRECLERHITEALYGSRFATGLDTLEQDVSTFQHLQSLQFLSPGAFDCTAQFHVEWVRAQNSLLGLNYVQTPRQKMKLVVDCCRSLWKSLQAAGNAAASDQPAATVDDFIPLLIFIVLKANVPYLVSNCAWVEHFRGDHDANGEAAYYWTSFSSAVAFLRDLKDCENLSIDKKRFEGRLNKWRNDEFGFDQLLGRFDQGGTGSRLSSSDSFMLTLRAKRSEAFLDMMMRLNRRQQKTQQATPAVTSNLIDF